MATFSLCSLSLSVPLKPHFSPLLIEGTGIGGITQDLSSSSHLGPSPKDQEQVLFEGTDQAKPFRAPEVARGGAVPMNTFGDSWAYHSLDKMKESHRIQRRQRRMRKSISVIASKMISKLF